MDRWIDLITFGGDEAFAKLFASEVKPPYRVIKNIKSLDNTDNELVIEDIKAQRFDYIVILSGQYNHKLLKDITEKSGGVLNYSNYVNNDRWDPKFVDHRKQSDCAGYYLGMSHSAMAFLPWMIDVKLKDYCDGSMDMFMYYQVINNLIREDNAQFKTAKL